MAEPRAEESLWFLEYLGRSGKWIAGEYYRDEQAAKTMCDIYNAAPNGFIGDDPRYRVAKWVPADSLSAPQKGA